MAISTAVPPPLRAPAANPRPAAANPAAEHVRRDLQGLRALAVVGVVICHLRDSWLPGGFAGVDVFFVLSGYFITGHLLRELDATGSLDLARFWARRVRRLLPAATAAIVGTLLAGFVVADALDAERFARDGGWAAAFGLNWRLAREGTNYFADPDPSPFTHFWSLGVEEQFYLGWPILLIIVSGVITAAGRRVLLRPVMLAVVGGLGVASFCVALEQTHGNQPYAYFATYARVWELGLGAALAGLAPLVERLPAWTATPVRWAGVALIVAFYVAAPVDGTYPGWYLLVPAAGTAAVIIAGRPGRPAPNPSRDPVERLLSSAPGQLLGRYSYGWYLWHWGPLVLFPLLLGHALTPAELWACAGGSLVLAVLSYHLLEQPVRRARRIAGRRWSAALGAGLVATSLIAALGGYASAHHDATHSHVTDARGRALVPQPAVAAAQLPLPTRDGCEVSRSATTPSPECRYLPSSGRGDVVLVGDSHAAQWYPAVRVIAEREQWGLRVWTKASCPLADVSKNIGGAPGTACNRWRDDVMKRLIAARPSLVIVANYASVVPSLFDRESGALVGGARSRALFADGLRYELRRLRDAHIPVLLIRDNPSYDFSGPKCALEHERDPGACSATRTRALSAAEDLRAAESVPGVHWVDFTSAFCDARRCHQVVGDVLAYRDANHLTAEMTRQLVPRLAVAARAALTRG